MEWYCCKYLKNLNFLGIYRYSLTGVGVARFGVAQHGRSADTGLYAGSNVKDRLEGETIYRRIVRLRMPGR